MQTDPTEQARRALVESFQGRTDEDILGPTWTTQTLQEDFVVHAFLAPFCVVTKKDTREKGTLLFRHSPRVYWGWAPDPQR